MRKKSYRRLRDGDRHTIYRMSKAGKTQVEIAQALGVSQSTVSKELARNRGQRGYRPIQAHRKATDREAAKKKRSCVIIGAVKEAVDDRLGRKHSPEQISLKLKAQGMRVSHESIYQYVLRDKQEGGELWKELRINGKRCYRRRVKGQRTKIPNRRGIEERPQIVNLRRRYGDWEADLIEGTKGSGFILSLYERKIHIGKLLKLETKSKEETTAGILKQLKAYRVKSVTYDNGLEFSGHEEISEALNAKGYFCRPYHSWEKGGVENFNGLVRQYLPKGTDFSDLTNQTLKQIENEINRRPRKTLNIKSPSELEYKIAA